MKQALLAVVFVAFWLPAGVGAGGDEVHCPDGPAANQEQPVSGLTAYRPGSGLAVVCTSPSSSETPAALPETAAAGSAETARAAAPPTTVTKKTAAKAKKAKKTKRTRAIRRARACLRK
jgi:hypothetical protein